jgi:outer membrane receptor for ferrienterochelin and colicin
VRVAAFFILICLFAVSGASAQPASGRIHGIVTTQGSIPLPGAEVVVRDVSGREVSRVLCGEDGRFAADGLAPAVYSVTATLPGFVAVSSKAVVTAGATVDLSLDVAIEGVSQVVEVVGASPVVSVTSTLAPSDVIGGTELDQLAPSGGLQAGLRLLANIIEVPGGVSIKGGRPTQVGVQLGPTSLVDTATGLRLMTLPDDAIDTVAVLPNPYAVEYGRFSSGLVLIQTRRAGDQWKVRLNNLDPAFRTKRGSPVNLHGIGWWAPRLEAGGPLVKGRLFVEQTAQYRYAARDVASLPPDQLRVSNSFSSFTRIDANVTPRHSLVATGGVFPDTTRQATLGTFTPPPATVDIRSRATDVALTERALWTDTVFTETTGHVQEYDTNVAPQGQALMQLQPDTTRGNFFNQQQRHTSAYQIIETVSGSRQAPGGLHLFKLGVDLLQSRYDGQSTSRPVLIERADGTLARRLDFVPSPVQTSRSTDVAVFAQDRVQANARWYVEFGGRLDRDGVVGRFNLTPRVGTAVLLDASGDAVLRGGFGQFYERTPSTAGAFEQFESEVDTRFGADGVTPLAPPVEFVHATSSLHTPRSTTWDISYDHRLNANWSFHTGVLDRNSSRELILEPVRTPVDAELLLSSTGRSHYRGAEVGLRYVHASNAELNVTYARSAASGDLNAFATYFDAVLSPVIGENMYARASTDVPHRLTARGRLLPTDRWLLIGIFDWRTGLPYSIVDESLDFVGIRDSERFPPFVRLEVGVERRFNVGKFRPWIGVRVWNALNAFLPNDVQANQGSPAFGSFYNSEYRQFRIQLRFER